jgi:peptidyl-prolyl cis-trans isomerase SurA
MRSDPQRAPGPLSERGTEPPTEPRTSESGSRRRPPTEPRTSESGSRRHLGVLLAFALLFPLHGEIIDRIAVSVSNRVVTASDLDREIRVTAFLDGKPADFSPAAKRATAERLVEQQLIRRELETNRYPMPSAADVAPILDKFERDHFKDVADFERALAAAGITAQDVKDELLWQRGLLLFINARFRLGVQVSDRQIEDYFEKVVKPAAQAAHPGATVALDDYRQSIEDTLAGPMVDHQLDEWLKEVRGRTDIVYHDEVFQ